MATAKQYASQVYEVQKAIAFKMGLLLDGGPKNVRVVVKSTSIVVGVLMKLLVDKGLVTNAELSDAYDFVGGDNYPDEPLDPPDGG